MTSFSSAFSNILLIKIRFYSLTTRIVIKLAYLTCPFVVKRIILLGEESNNYVKGDKQSCTARIEKWKAKHNISVFLNFNIRNTPKC